MDVEAKGLVIAVDDEENNLVILEYLLKRAGYDVLKADNALDAWDMLNENREIVDVVVLDRMMQEVNGMQLLGIMNGDTDLCHIPVVMQTAAVEPRQVAEGIEAGVFYYLTKPYDEEVFNKVVNAAFEFRMKQRELIGQVAISQQLVGFLKEARFEYRTLDEAQDLAALIGGLFPNPAKVVFGLSELLVNAVEHGNLGITYNEKSLLNPETSWVDEVKIRLALPKNVNKKVVVDYRQDAGEGFVLTITDEGKGFDWEKYMELDSGRMNDGHGRGIAYARMMSFDEVTYNPLGNQVTCKVSS
jgi:DNA-binding response OmpR family regulator